MRDFGGRRQSGVSCEDRGFDLLSKKELKIDEKYLKIFSGFKMQLFRELSGNAEKIDKKR